MPLFEVALNRVSRYHAFSPSWHLSSPFLLSPGQQDWSYYYLTDLPHLIFVTSWRVRLSRRPSHPQAPPSPPSLPPIWQHLFSPSVSLSFSDFWTWLRHRQPIIMQQSLFWHYCPQFLFWHRCPCRRAVRPTQRPPPPFTASSIFSSPVVFLCDNLN